MILETIKIALELAKAGVELGKEIYKVAKTVKKDVEKARALRRSKERDSKAAKEYDEQKKKLVVVSAPSPSAAAGSGGGGAAAPTAEVLQGAMVLKTLGISMSGTFVDGELEGQGIFQNSAVRYEGAFVKGEYHGVGKIQYLQSGCTYTGQFEFGVPKGTGKFVTKNGSELTGTFEDGHLVQGIIVTPKGILFEGSVEGWQPKYGTIRYPSGLVYRGEVKDWMWQGRGVLLYPSKNKQTGKEYKALSYLGEFNKCVLSHSTDACSRRCYPHSCIRFMCRCAFHGQGEMKWKSGYK